MVYPVTGWLLTLAITLFKALAKGCRISSNILPPLTMQPPNHQSRLLAFHKLPDYPFALTSLLQKH